MYRRYSQVGNGNMSISQVNRNRIKNIVIVILLIALAALLVISLPKMRTQDEARSIYILQMQRECKEAVDATTTLSRTGGASSAADLSKIRCNIHSIRMINSLSASMGSRLLDDDNALVTLLNLVDRYQQGLLEGGTNTGEYTTTLQTGLLELQEKLANLD